MFASFLHSARFARSGLDHPAAPVPRRPCGLCCDTRYDERQAHAEREVRLIFHLFLSFSGGIHPSFGLLFIRFSICCVRPHAEVTG